MLKAVDGLQRECDWPRAGMKKERAADDTRGELPRCGHGQWQSRGRDVQDATCRLHMTIRYVLLALVPVLIGLLLQPLHLGHAFSLGPNTTQNTPPRILLLTAHPDDETFFFGPTLTSLIPSFAAPVSASSKSNASDTVTLTFPQVYSLCFSVGNADGLGDIRRRELGDSLDVLGVAEDRRWILDEAYVS